MLPLKCDDPKFVQSLNDRPGILALAMRKTADATTGKTTMKGIPFVVPGARFNELYNWDSYFISLGLLVDGKVDMAKGMVEHFIFEIKHYGKILNGSRSYYLCRSQPPFLTDMALQTYNQLDRSEAQGCHPGCHQGSSRLPSFALLSPLLARLADWHSSPHLCVLSAGIPHHLGRRASNGPHYRSLPLSTRRTRHPSRDRGFPLHPHPPALR
jgi:hypothetical protein